MPSELVFEAEKGDDSGSESEVKEEKEHASQSGDVEEKFQEFRNEEGGPGMGNNGG